ncbi:hypothetical protein COCOBI_12-3030 [Coccomyxa sp. Obi]|nr:hypothetical protein COCOBI_12-3030 [Coccomyxa sp. Obi]
MPQFLDATVASAPAISQEAPMGAFARASREAPADWWAPKLPTHSSGLTHERHSCRQSPQVSWSPHTTPTSPMNHSREMSQLSMFRLNSETEVDQASSCEGDLGPCTSDGMPTSAPSSAFNLGPIAHPKPAPAGAQTHDRGLSMQHRAAAAQAQSCSQEAAPLFLPLPQPQHAPVPLGETLVGLSTVVLDGESGVHQKASLDSSASVWSPLLTTGVAALQTTGGASSGRGDSAAPPRLPAAPSLQSWAGSLEGPAALAGHTSTYSSPVAAGREAETAPSSPAVQVGEMMAAGRDTDVVVQGDSVSLSMLAQGTSIQSSPQLNMSSREGTPTGASPGKSWGGPEAAARPSFWEPQSLEARPGSLPTPSVSGATAEAAADVLPGEGRRHAAKSLDPGQYSHGRDSWAAAYAGSDRPSTGGAVSGPSGTVQNTVTPGASICARLREEQQREAKRDSSEPAGMASRRSRPALRERTDSAVYHRANHEEAPMESTGRQEACALPEPTSPQCAARERSSELVTGYSGGCSSGAAGLGGIQEEPAQRGRSREREPDAVAHVLRANLSSSEVQLSRRARDMLESGPAPGSLLAQVGIGGYKTAAPTGSAPASGDLRKSSLWDDSARTSCGHTDADGTDKAWPGLAMSSAPNSGGVVRSFASAHDGSRLDRELSSPYTSSAFQQAQGEGVPGGVLTGQISAEPARAQHDSLEQQSSAERKRAAVGAESRTAAHGHSQARQATPGPAAAASRTAAAPERAEDGGSRARRAVESSALSSGSGGPRLTEALLAELEAHHKLQARREKLVDVHERTRAWLAAAELSLETEGRAKKLAAARIKSLKSSDSAHQRSSSSPTKAANKKAAPGKQKKQGGLGHWFSCFAGRGVK